MSKQDVSLLQGGQARVFVQSSVSPDSPYRYFGCVALDGPTQNLGAVKPVYCPSSSIRGAWDQVGTIRSAPAMGTTGFSQHMNRSLVDIWWDLKEKGCKFNLQVVLGACQRPDQFDAWDSKIVLKDTYLTDIKLPALNPVTPDNNEVVDISGTLSFVEMSRMRPISFEEVADTKLLAELVAGFYYDFPQCGDCGRISDGCGRQYWLQNANAGSPGLSGVVLYTIDGGLNWNTIDIPPLGGLSGTDMVPVGAYCVVFSKAANALFWIKFDDLNAGTTTAWQKVTTGFVAAKGPNDAYVKSSSEVFVAADSGYIYEMINPASGVIVLSDGSITTQNLNAIDGNGNTIVAVGGSNAVLKSINGGLSFSLITGPLPTANLTAVACVAPGIWFVGGNLGAVGYVYYTTDFGANWTRVAMDAITTVENIKFVDELVGYMAVTRGVSGDVYRTTDGGISWVRTSPAITGLPANSAINDVAPCGYNKVAAGGRKTVGGDGILAVAE